MGPVTLQVAILRAQSLRKGGYWHTLTGNEKLEGVAIPGILRFLGNPFGFLLRALVSELLGPSPEFLGKVGESEVNRGLALRLDRKVYRLVKDVTLPVGAGSTQIDHLVVSPYGIFVIETKNMTGWIFGRPDDAQWTQMIYGDKQRFRNPLRQNYAHVRAVQELLGLGRHQVHNVVVFVGDCEFRTPMPPAVVYGVRDLAHYIRAMRVPVFAEYEVPRLLEEISEKRLAPGFRTRRTHEQNVRRQMSTRAVDPGACPVCGGVMAVRTNRRSGERFLGCTEYPRCRGTRPLA